MAGLHPNTVADVYDHTYDISIEEIPYPNTAVEVHDHACDVCIDFRFFFLTQSMRNIKVTASSGCRTCALLRDAIQSYTPELDDSTEFTVHKGPSVLEVIYTDGSSDSVSPAQTPHPIRLTLFVNCSGDDGSYQVYPVPASKIPSISGDTASPRAKQLAQEWLSKCLLEHEPCKISGLRELPTRILDVQSFERSNDIRLYESNREAVPYCTLSHCWGTVPVIKLTQNVLDRYKERIQFDWLPRTFQDAVTFTRSLSVRYLWIDSLCIIQDTDDWNSEASKMAAVYSGSYLTIAASKGSNAEDGLFSNVGSDHTLRPLKFTKANGELAEGFVRRKISHLDPEQKFPLLSRAWVLQERILSPRVLHFGPQELLWECMEVRQCECSFVNAPSMSDHMAAAKRRYMCLFSKTCPSSHGLDLWRSIVSQYTLLKLTYSKDIFSALAGLAQRSMPLIGSNYIAGLWFNNALPGYLLWRTPVHLSIPYMTDYNLLAPRLSPARAPTWSWASVQSPVEFPEYHGFWSPWDRLGCSHSLVNQFTGLPRGSIYVISQLMLVKLQRIGRNYAGTSTYEIALHMDGENIEGLSCRLDYDIWKKDGNEVQDGSILLCAIVGYSWTEEDWPGDVTPETLESEEKMAKATLHCLILRNRSMSELATGIYDEAMEQEKVEEEPQSARSSHEVPALEGESLAIVNRECDMSITDDGSGEELRSADSKKIKTISHSSDTMADIRSQAEKHDNLSQGNDELRDTAMQDLEDSRDDRSEADDAESSEEDGFPKFERIGVAELAPADNGSLTAFLRSCLEAPFFEIKIA